jgi:ribonuclease E
VLTKVEEAATSAAETAVEILDIPVSRSSRSSRRISTQDAEEILGSVLGALPEPKLAGQGRTRGSRRASSSGAVVTPSETAE